MRQIALKYVAQKTVFTTSVFKILVLVSIQTLRPRSHFRTSALCDGVGRHAGGVGCASKKESPQKLEEEAVKVI